MDELGYLRDGVQGDSLASRRSRQVLSHARRRSRTVPNPSPLLHDLSAIDILSKCADAAWFERLRVCGQIESIYEDFAKAGKDRSDEVCWAFKSRIPSRTLLTICAIGARSRIVALSGTSVAVFERSRYRHTRPRKRDLQIPGQHYPREAHLSSTISFQPPKEESKCKSLQAQISTSRLG